VPGVKKRRAPSRLLVWFVALAAFVATLGIAGRPVYHLTRTAMLDQHELEPLPDGHIDDASRLNETVVREIWRIPEDATEAEAQLAALLARAREENLIVSVAGARHSMGGQVIAPDGIVIDMRPFKAMRLDEAGDVLWVQAGATWDDVIPFLDARGRSVIVMQSNSSFSVGGSLSVNCHGWQYGLPPIASTVESFRLMKADGEIVRCSRSENAELFSLSLGGYGLFGVILDAELRVTKNARLRRVQREFAVDEAFSAFDQARAAEPEATMLYGRLNIVRERFLEDIVMVWYAPEDGEVPVLAPRQAPGLRRTIFRGSDDDYGKRLRWRAETLLLPHVSRESYSRNELLYEGVEVYQNRSAATTDILHEYFVPQKDVWRFLAELRRIVPKYDGNLLNVTVRQMETDRDTFLRYADRTMFAFVMLFIQDRTDEGEEAMRSMTREMIDAAILCDGRYYLPYRLHATPEQFEAAYPMADAFWTRKRRFDPGEVFQNVFYQTYGKAETVAH
jgi:FAD/FMN-containing dehydrogenase